MEQDKKNIIKKIDELQNELQILAIKQETLNGIIAALRSKQFVLERRKRQIHYEIVDIQDKVRAWESAKSKNETENNQQ